MQRPEVVPPPHFQAYLKLKDVVNSLEFLLISALVHESASVLLRLHFTAPEPRGVGINCSKALFSYRGGAN